MNRPAYGIHHHLLRPAEVLHETPQKIEVTNSLMATTVVSWTGAALAGMGQAVVPVFPLLPALSSVDDFLSK